MVDATAQQAATPSPVLKKGDFVWAKRERSPWLPGVVADCRRASVPARAADTRPGGDDEEVVRVNFAYSAVLATYWLPRAAVVPFGGEHDAEFEPAASSTPFAAVVLQRAREAYNAKQLGISTSAVAELSTPPPPPVPPVPPPPLSSSPMMPPAGSGEAPSASAAVAPPGSPSPPAGDAVAEAQAWMVVAAAQCSKLEAELTHVQAACVELRRMTEGMRAVSAALAKAAEVSGGEAAAAAAAAPRTELEDQLSAAAAAAAARRAELEAELAALTRSQEDCAAMLRSGEKRRALRVRLEEEAEATAAAQKHTAKMLLQAEEAIVAEKAALAKKRDVESAVQRADEEFAAKRSAFDARPRLDDPAAPAAKRARVCDSDVAAASGDVL